VHDVMAGILPDLKLEVPTGPPPGAELGEQLAKQMAAVKNAFTKLADESEARRYDLSSIWEDTLKPLNKYRAAIAELGRSTLLVDDAIYEGTRRLVEQWDAAAIRVGTVHEKFRGFFNELILEGQNFGEEMFRAMHNAIEGVEDELARLV